MIMLILGCLLGDPSSCEQDRIVMQQLDAPPMACLANSQSLLAEWKAGHPERFVKEFKCVSKKRIETTI